MISDGTDMLVSGVITHANPLAAPLAVTHDPAQMLPAVAIRTAEIKPSDRVA